MYPAFNTTESPNLNSEGIFNENVPSSEEAVPTFNPKTEIFAYDNASPSLLVTVPETCVLPNA